MVETALLTTLRARIHAFAASRVGSDSAEDIAQETMLVLHQRYQHLTEPADLIPVALQIARFKITAFFRKMKRRGEDDAQSVDDLQLTNGQMDPEMHAVRQELMNRLEAALPKLGERCRELFRLKLDGLSFPEIQREMGATTINTVYTWDLRCRKSLLELVGGKWTPEERKQ